MDEKIYEVRFGAKPACMVKCMRCEVLQATSDRNVFVRILYLKSVHWSLFVSSLGLEAVCVLMGFPQEIWPEEM